MLPKSSRWASLALVGLSLTWAGCGGSDSGDSAADAPKDEAAPVAAADAAPSAKGGAPAPEAGAGKEEVAAADAGAGAPAAAPATKGDSSATSELLALSNAAPAAPAAADAAPAAGGAEGGVNPPVQGGLNPMAQPIPGAPGGNPMGQPIPGAPGAGANPPPGYGAPGGIPGAPGAGPAGAAGFPGGQAIEPGAGGPAGGRGIPGGQGMLPGGPGGPGGPGAEIGGGGAGAPSGGIYAAQFKAVTEFLAAVKSKDKDALAEATALRAPTEATGERNKKLFTAIRESSISDAELDELAKAFEGFQIVSMNEARSTGRLGIVLQKNDEGGDVLRRTVTVRKEAKGWKVVDVSGLGKIDNFTRPQTKRPGTGKGR